jgi:hypothetical protein
MIPRNQFRHDKYVCRVIVPARQATQAGGIDSLESNLGLLERLQIRALLVNKKSALQCKKRKLASLSKTQL